jgi:hypothetical protein
VTRGEERTTTFLLTALTTGFLTEGLTRFMSLMRATVSVRLSLPLGLFFLALLFIHFGLLITDD